MKGLPTKLLAEGYAGQDCTLDGKPARILGRLNKFATVVDYSSHRAVEFSWNAVNRVMLADGKFHS